MSTPHAHVEYVGFVVTERWREYTLRLVQTGAEPRHFTLAIATAAFLSNRVRYQDAPDVCFLKLQRALDATPGVLPARRLSVSDAELAEYRVAHTPKPPTRRPRPPSGG